jgi:hypothetical protein
VGASPNHRLAYFAENAEFNSFAKRSIAYEKPLSAIISHGKHDRDALLVSVQSTYTYEKTHGDYDN